MKRKLRCSHRTVSYYTQSNPFAIGRRTIKNIKKCDALTSLQFLKRLVSQGTNCENRDITRPVLRAHRLGQSSVRRATISTRPRRLADRAFISSTSPHNYRKLFKLRLTLDAVDPGRQRRHQHAPGQQSNSNPIIRYKVSRPHFVAQHSHMDHTHLFYFCDVV